MPLFLRPAVLLALSACGAGQKNFYDCASGQVGDVTCGAQDCYDFSDWIDGEFYCVCTNAGVMVGVEYGGPASCTLDECAPDACATSISAPTGYAGQTIDPAISKTSSTSSPVTHKYCKQFCSMWALLGNNCTGYVWSASCGSCNVLMVGAAQTGTCDFYGTWLTPTDAVATTSNVRWGYNRPRPSPGGQCSHDLAGTPVCTAPLQTCHDDTSAVGNWQCRCVADTSIQNLLAAVTVTCPTPTSSPATPAPPTPAPPTPAPATLAPPTPAPATHSPPTPAPPTPVPKTLAPQTPAPATLAPPTPAPATHSPPTLAPLTPAPPSPAPQTPVPATLAPPTPAPATHSPPTPAPPTLTPIPQTPSPVTPAPATPAPVTAPPPTTSAPATFVPQTLPPGTITPETVSPVTPAPSSPGPASAHPNIVPATPAPAAPPTSAPATATPIQSTTVSAIVASSSGTLAVEVVEGTPAPSPSKVAARALTGKPAATLESVGTTASVAVAGAAFAGGGGAATRLVALTLGCGESIEYLRALSPLGLVLSGSAALGAIVGNALLAVAVLVVARLAVRVAGLHSAAPLAALQLLYQGTAIAAVDLTVNGMAGMSPALGRGVGVLTVATCVAVPVMICRAVTRGVPVKAFIREDRRTQWVEFLLARGEWVNRDAGSHWVENWSPVVRPYAMHVPWFGVVDFVSTFAVAVVVVAQGFANVTYVSCGVGRMVLALTLAVIQCLILCKWPLLAPRNAIFDVLIVGTEALSQAALAVGYLSEGGEAWLFEVAADLLLGAAVVMGMRTACDLGAAGWVLFTRRRERLQDAWMKEAGEGEGMELRPAVLTNGGASDPLDVSLFAPHPHQHSLPPEASSVANDSLSPLQSSLYSPVFMGDSLTSPSGPRSPRLGGLTPRHRGLSPRRDRADAMVNPFARRDRKPTFGQPLERSVNLGSTPPYRPTRTPSPSPSWAPQTPRVSAFQPDLKTTYDPRSRSYTFAPTPVALPLAQ
eukprot:TRINITY_DN6710_c0_g1_i2.p1 TRINITY_DN6710_c0_g1~~TRINITY_DN6710_c0_g1_i2.p1  ORF type:complete len:991 (+),score=17.44 TRINITY_DN6710_c0_g1_i2:45-3017(+)